jgi:hypothetical protein
VGRRAGAANAPRGKPTSGRHRHPVAEVVPDGQPAGTPALDGQRSTADLTAETLHLVQQFAEELPDCPVQLH